MGNQQSRIKYFKENDIDPYNILGIKKSNLPKSIDKCKKKLKKAYHAKAVLCHPDKTNGTTEIEFKLLYECYMYILKTLEDTYDQKDHSELKKSSKNSIKTEDTHHLDDTRDFYRTNFEDKSVRDRLFVNGSDIPVDKTDEIIKKKSKGPTNYKNVEKVNHLNMFKNNKFDVNSFNAVFEIQQKKNKKGQDNFLGEPSAIDAETSLSLLPIDVYNGLLLEKRQHNDFKMDSEEDNDVLVDDIPKKQLTKMVNKMKRDAKPLSKKKLKDLYNARSNEKFDVDTSKSYHENEQRMYDNHIKKIKNDMIENKKNILKSLSVYPENVIQQFNDGLLEDSSTALFGESLEVPKGIRYD